MDQSVGSSAKHLGTTAKRQTQIGLSGVTLPRFQQARGEVGARHGIIGMHRQCASIGVGGISIVTVQQQDASERRQDVTASRRGSLCSQQDRSRLAALVVFDVEARQVQLQLDNLRRKRESGFDNRNGLSETPALGKLPGKFLEGRQERRPTRCRPAQLLDGFGTTAGMPPR